MNPAPLPPRPPDAHKGVFGMVCVVGGQCDDDAIMIGAPALAARAALRSGCGRVVIAADGAVAENCLQLCPSATGHPLALDSDGGVHEQQAIESVRRLDTQVQSLLIGPGLGTKPWVAGLVNTVLDTPGPPLVIDADALTVLACGEAPSLDATRRSVVLTPHPGEFDSLAQAWSLPLAGETSETRTAAAVAMAQRCGCVVVLKGHGTVVADSSGDHWCCAQGGPELATAGTGDVLAGLIAGLAAQQPDADTASLTCLAVECHAAAGAHWRTQHGDRGMLAQELADAIPEVIRLRGTV